MENGQLRVVLSPMFKAVLFPSVLNKKKCNWSVNQPFDAVKLPETKSDLAEMIDTYSGWQLIHLIGSYSFWNELDRVKSSQSQM